MSKVIIGVDISKDYLDAHRNRDGASRQFANDDKGHAAFLVWAKPSARQHGTEPHQIVFEATGRYHLSFEARLANTGLAYAKLNPVQVKRFGQALGVRAKTDAADAALLARMGAVMDFPATVPTEEQHRSLNALRSARHALIKDRTAAKNRAGGLQLPLLQRQNDARLARIEEDLAEIDRAMATLISKHSEMARKRDILMSVPGIGRTTADALIALAPELGHCGGPQIAKLAGLAPITRSSGKWKGHASIRAGRGPLREALFMPALVAAQRNPDLAAFSRRLKDAGKPGMVVVTAVMRKLLILANALIRDDREWTPKMP